jgi:hypothetical protein
MMSVQFLLFDIYYKLIKKLCLLTLDWFKVIKDEIIERLKAKDELIYLSYSLELKYNYMLQAS